MVILVIILYTHIGKNIRGKCQETTIGFRYEKTPDTKQE